MARVGAETAQNGAESARDAAVVAQGKAESAEDGAVAAKSAAEADRDAASGSASAASSSATAADSSATTAAQSASAAAGSASDAQASADAAAQSEATASSAAAGAASGVRSELAGLVSDASGHASAAASSAAAAAQSAQDAASVVSDGVPDASTTIKGKVRLSGDLAGTADNPTVPGLATKANTSHTHSVAQVTGLQSALDGKVSTVTDASRVYGTSSAGAQTAYLLGGTNASSGTVPLRVTGGAINTGEPTDSSHATTKNYVDTAVESVSAVASAALPAAQIQVVTALPASPVAGVIYLVTGA